MLHSDLTFIIGFIKYQFSCPSYHFIYFLFIKGRFVLWRKWFESNIQIQFRTTWRCLTLMISPPASIFSFSIAGQESRNTLQSGLTFSVLFTWLRWIGGRDRSTRTLQRMCVCVVDSDHLILWSFRCDFDDTAQYQVSAMNAKGELSAYASVVVKSKEFP